MAGDDNIVKLDAGSSSDMKFVFGDPLYLHPNDTSGTPIVSIKLSGTENYKVWSIAMQFALRNHNKLGFIDGTCVRDNSNSGLANQWDTCNSVVVTWILNSLSAELFAGAIYSKTAFEMWKDLKESSRAKVLLCWLYKEASQLGFRHLCSFTSHTNRRNTLSIFLDHLDLVFVFVNV